MPHKPSHKGSKPPGLTTSSGKESCASCRHFDGLERCERFNYPVRPFHVSDAYEAKAKTPSLRDPTGTVQINVNTAGSNPDSIGDRTAGA